MQQLIAVLGRARAVQSVWLEAWIAAEHGRFALWLPVSIGSGVLCYFALRDEPPLWLGVAVALPAMLCALLARSWIVPRAVFLVVAAVALGFAATQLATAMAPQLDALPTHAAVLRGTVRGLEALPDGRRITLDAVTIEGADEPLHRRLHLRLRGNDATQVAQYNPCI